MDLLPNFDSLKGTIDHIQSVREKLYLVITELLGRALNHDKSKTESPEKEGYDFYAPMLRVHEYGSDRYWEILKEMQPILDHHYKNNRHHPEFVQINQEWWKDTVNIDGYEISSLGQLRSKDRTIKREGQGDFFKAGQPIKSYKTPKGYLRVGLSQDGKLINKFLHVLVAEAFIPNPDNKPFVNHMDGIKTNNAISNLEWVTSSENQIHAYDTGLKDPNTKYIVKCVDLDIITDGTNQMEKELRKRGYEKASASGVWASINNDNRKHLDLTFEGYLIEEFGTISYMDGMNLIDLLEMLCDWKAAGERQPNSSILKSIDINAERFNMSPQLKQILQNTASFLEWI